MYSRSFAKCVTLKVRENQNKPAVSCAGFANGRCILDTVSIFVIAYHRRITSPRGLDVPSVLNHRFVQPTMFGFACRCIHLVRPLSSTLSITTFREMSVKIAVVQLTSKQNKDDNFKIAQSLVEGASRDGAKMAFLPECFDMVCPSKQITLDNGEPIDGPIVQRYQALARENSIWLSLGGLHEKDTRSEDKRLFNAHLIVNDRGEIVSVYRKVHLFNLDIPGTRLVESEFSQPGNAIIKPVETPAGRVGQGICYDLRFAEMAISLAKGGADILTVNCFKIFVK